MNGSDNATQDPICTRPTPNFETKYYLVMVCGTAIAGTSAVENTAVFLLFNSRAQFRSSHTFFLKILALMDILISLSYVATFPVEVMMNLHQSLELSKVFHSYIRPLFTISQVALTASTFLILAASLERYVTTCRKELAVYTQRMRIVTAAIAIGSAFLIKGTVYFETMIAEKKECFNHRRYYITYSSLGRNWYFNTIWMFWLRHVFTVFLPFVLVAYMNCAIVMGIREKKVTLRGAGLPGTPGAGLPINSGVSVRRATRMLLLVVASYLGANVLNVGVAVWEHVDLVGLLTTYLSFYSVVTDVISLLTITASALRLPIYLYCNVQVRKELASTLQRNGRALSERMSFRSRGGTGSSNLSLAQRRKLWKTTSVDGAVSKNGIGPQHQKQNGVRRPLVLLHSCPAASDTLRRKASPSPLVHSPLHTKPLLNSNNAVTNNAVTINAFSSNSNKSKNLNRVKKRRLSSGGPLLQPPLRIGQHFFFPTTNECFV